MSSLMQIGGQSERLSQAGSPYDYLPAVLADIEAGAGPERVIQAIRGYAELGLWAPAGELLECLDPQERDAPGLAKVREAVDAGKTGRLSWKICRGRFQRNLQPLVERDERLAVVGSAWDAVRDQFELYRCADGNYQVRQATGDGRHRWVPALGDHRQWADRQQLQHDEKALFPAPYLFEGLGLGQYFRRAYESTLNTFLGYSCALFVVERDPAALALCLHLDDWQDILADPRVMVFVGDDCLERWADTVSSDENLALPHCCVQLPRWSPALQPPPMDTVVRVDQERQARDAEDLARIQAQYAGRDVRYWACRFAEALDGSGPPLRILSAVSIHTTFLQYSMRDAHRAFERLGCQTRLLTEASNHHHISPAAYHRAVAEFDPDVCFILDHLRGGHEAWIPANLPMFSWDQDMLPHAVNAQTVQTMGPLDVMAGLSKRAVVEQMGLAEDKCIHAHLGTNLEVFNPEPLPEAELAPYDCDVSYVSNASQTPKQFHDEQRAGQTDQRMRSLLDDLYEQICEWSGHSPHINMAQSTRMLEAASGRCGLRLPDPVRAWLQNWYTWRLLDRIFRHQALDWVADWARRGKHRFYLYGNGWDKHDTLGQFARGFAENGHQLRCIYQASVINLQLIPSGFVHQRAIDGLAAGGFFLTRRSQGDYEGRMLARVYRRCVELGVDAPAKLRACADPELQEAVAACAEYSADPLSFDGDDLLKALRLQLENFSTSEAFPRFDEIVFDDAESFARLADRFIGDPAARREIAQGMHQVVREQFTYDALMRRFLEFHAGYLAQQV